MRIAISTDGDFVSPHFGRCPIFTIIDIENGEVVKREILENPGHQPGSIPQFLRQQGVECIVCGGMGRRATGFFSEYGIETILGVTGRVDEVLEKIQKGTLEGGESLCRPGSGKGYGLDKTECDHPGGHQGEHRRKDD
jgi:predicted Fe-Mo cluster-binding NifX family protein